MLTMQALGRLFCEFTGVPTDTVKTADVYTRLNPHPERPCPKESVREWIALQLRRAKEQTPQSSWKPHHLSGLTGKACDRKGNRIFRGMRLLSPRPGDEAQQGPHTHSLPHASPRPSHVEPDNEDLAHQLHRLLPPPVRNCALPELHVDEQLGETISPCPTHARMGPTHRLLPAPHTDGVLTKPLAAAISPCPSRVYPADVDTSREQNRVLLPPSGDGALTEPLAAAISPCPSRVYPADVDAAREQNRVLSSPSGDGALAEPLAEAISPCPSRIDLANVDTAREQNRVLPPPSGNCAITDPHVVEYLEKEVSRRLLCSARRAEVQQCSEEAWPGIVARLAHCFMDRAGGLDPEQLAKRLRDSIAVFSFNANGLPAAAATLVVAAPRTALRGTRSEAYRLEDAIPTDAQRVLLVAIALAKDRGAARELVAAVADVVCKLDQGIYGVAIQAVQGNERLASRYRQHWGFNLAFGPSDHPFLIRRRGDIVAAARGDLPHMDFGRDTGGPVSTCKLAPRPQDTCYEFDSDYQAAWLREKFSSVQPPPRKRKRAAASSQADS